MAKDNIEQKQHLIDLMNMKTQTAVEWLIEQLKINNYISDNAHWLVDDAKEMEKQQIIEARVKKPLESEWLEAEQYYNETFKKE
jgi:hypothetical protein